jgi:hypothetical protein
MRLLKLLLLGVVALAVAYGAGWWPERKRAAAIEAEKAQLQGQLQAAEAKVRAGQLLGELLTIKETVQDLNYGQARGLSSPFFDHVRAETARATDPATRQALESIQILRDPVTIALTQGDAAALGHLREAERRLRVALGYPAPPAVTAAPSAAPPMLPAPASPGPPGSVAPGPASPAPGNPLGLPSPSPSM